MLAIETGLVTLFADATLTAAVGGRVYRDPAPEGVAHPVLVFQVRRLKVDTLDSPGHSDNGYFDVTATVKIIDQSEDQSAAAAAFDRVGTLLMGNTLAVSGYVVMGVQRGSEFSYPEYENGRTYQHVGGEFRILVQPQ